MMVEAGGTEASWELYEEGAPKVTEETIAQGLEESKRWIKASIDLQTQLREQYEKTRGPIDPIDYLPAVDYSDEIYDAVQQYAEADTTAAMAIGDKSERNTRLAEVEALTLAHLVGTVDAPSRYPESSTAVKRAFRSLQKAVTRRRIVTDGVRIDGRGPADIRPLSAEVGIVPTAHGTGLFKRGETQVLSVTTLGMPRMEQMLDTITVDEKKRYMHHYNFPPFSTGETGRVGSPKRREIGHGALAERALLPVVPDAHEWPYTLRVVSDVLASNGSTSMASVCGSTLSLMDAGVPIKAPVAGIAMGLVYAEGKYTTLTDILGAEDAFGDMDFKVAGTAEFVTALQLDTKIEGIPADVLAQALRQAKDARLKILDVMHGAIASPRAEVRDSAPKIVSFEIPIDKIGEVIGPKGKVINTIQQETGADIAVTDDDGVGIVSIGSKDGAAVERGTPADRADPRPADRRGRRRCTTAASSTSRSSARSSTSFRAATAWCTSRSSAAASASTGSKTCCRSATSSACASTTSTRTASSRCRSSARTATATPTRAAATVTTAVRSRAGDHASGRRVSRRRRRRGATSDETGVVRGVLGRPSARGVRRSRARRRAGAGAGRRP